MIQINKCSVLKKVTRVNKFKFSRGNKRASLERFVTATHPQ